MRPFLIFSIAASAAATSLEQPAADPQLGSYTVHGCYASVGELQLGGTNTFNTQSSCAESCEKAGAFVAATQQNSCYCGDKYPPASVLVDDSQCDSPCPGYSMNACGGSSAFTVINTGLKVEVEDSTGGSASSETSVTSESITVASSYSVSPTSIVTDFETTSTALGSSATTSAGVGSNTTSTTDASAGSASISPSPSTVGTSNAVSQISLRSLNIAILGLSAAFLV